MLIRADDLTRLVHDIFHAEGCSEAESGRIALYLVRALTGHDSHGVIRVPRYVARSAPASSSRTRPPRS